MGRINKAARYIQGHTVQMRCPTLICPPFTQEMVARYSKSAPVPACYYAGIPIMDPKKIPSVFIIETPYIPG